MKKILLIILCCITSFNSIAKQPSSNDDISEKVINSKIQKAIKKGSLYKPYDNMNPKEKKKFLYNVMAAGAVLKEDQSNKIGKNSVLFIISKKLDAIYILINDGSHPTLKNGTINLDHLAFSKLAIYKEKPAINKIVSRNEKELKNTETHNTASDNKISKEFEKKIYSQFFESYFQYSLKDFSLEISKDKDTNKLFNKCQVLKASLSGENKENVPTSEFLIFITDENKKILLKDYDRAVFDTQFNEEVSQCLYDDYNSDIEKIKKIVEDNISSLSSASTLGQDFNNIDVYGLNTRNASEYFTCDFYQYQLSQKSKKHKSVIATSIIALKDGKLINKEFSKDMKKGIQNSIKIINQCQETFVYLDNGFAKAIAGLFPAFVSNYIMFLKPIQKPKFEKNKIKVATRSFDKDPDLYLIFNEDNKIEELHLLKIIK